MAAVHIYSDVLNCIGYTGETKINVLLLLRMGRIFHEAISCVSEFVDVVGIRPINCQASGPSDFSDPNKRADITVANG